MEQKLKDFFPENSRNRKFLCKLETKSILFDSKIDFLGGKKEKLGEKLKNFYKTQGLICPKTQGFGKSTIFCCTTPKKNPGPEPQ